MEKKHSEIYPRLKPSLRLDLNDPWFSYYPSGDYSQVYTEMNGNIHECEQFIHKSDKPKAKSSHSPKTKPQIPTRQIQIGKGDIGYGSLGCH